MTERVQTGGQWDPEGERTYFLAVFPTMMRVLTGPFLVPCNSLSSSTALSAIDFASRKYPMLLDSGAFNLAASHARIHNMGFQQVLALPLKNLDGFNDLMKLYRKIIARYEKHSWGYVEMDLGGTDEKRRMRHEMEADGLYPIPVFHILSDPLEYLDEIAERYDRIAIGNISQAPRVIRKQILATVWDRLKDLEERPWVHVLGITPSDLTYAYPFDSVDSSSWNNSQRFPMALRPFSGGKQTGELSMDFKNAMGDKEQWERVMELGAYEAYFQALNWANHVGAMEKMRMEGF